MIITCPHCQTKYQVTLAAIGAAGRKVQCAHCSQAWQQVAPVADVAAGGGPLAPDEPMSAVAEDALDEDMARVEQAAQQLMPSRPQQTETHQPAPSQAELQKRQLAFSRRQNAMFSRLPLARLRRAGRIGGLVLLTAIIGFGYFGRVQIVERYPNMAGAYEAVGLGVNVVGLDFSNLETLRTLSDGKEVLLVSAQIVGLMPSPVPVPPVVISLLDEAGHAVYEWSVAPRVRDLMVGERASFDTRLSLPPSEAMRVRLSFAGTSAEPAVSRLPQSEVAASDVAEASAAPQTAAPASVPAPQHH